jgi:tetratricopeptide (TPR) repeat protein
MAIGPEMGIAAGSSADAASATQGGVGGSKGAGESSGAWDSGNATQVSTMKQSFAGSSPFAADEGNSTEIKDMDVLPGNQSNQLSVFDFISGNVGENEPEPAQVSAASGNFDPGAINEVQAMSNAPETTVMPGNGGEISQPEMAPAGDGNESLPAKAGEEPASMEKPTAAGQAGEVDNGSSGNLQSPFFAPEEPPQKGIENEAPEAKGEADGNYFSMGAFRDAVETFFGQLAEILPEDASADLLTAFEQLKDCFELVMELANDNADIGLQERAMDAFEKALEALEAAKEIALDSFELDFLSDVKELMEAEKKSIPKDASKVLAMLLASIMSMLELSDGPLLSEATWKGGLAHAVLDPATSAKAEEKSSHIRRAMERIEEFLKQQKDRKATKGEKNGQKKVHEKDKSKELDNDPTSRQKASEDVAPQKANESERAHVDQKDPDGSGGFAEGWDDEEEKKKKKKSSSSFESGGGKSAAPIDTQ